MPTVKKIKLKEGNVFAIPLGDGSFAFCRTLRSPLTEFFDLRGSTIPPLDRIVTSPVLFKIVVMKYAFTGNVWQLVGNVLLGPQDIEAVWFFKQDPTGELFLTRDGAEGRPATLKESVGLERAAGWDPEHVEERLRDHFAGRPNRWVESMKPKPIGELRGHPQ
jgi:hypothetical protein